MYGVYGYAIFLTCAPEDPQESFGGVQRTAADTDALIPSLTAGLSPRGPRPESKLGSVDLFFHLGPEVCVVQRYCRSVIS